MEAEQTKWIRNCDTSLSGVPVPENDTMKRQGSDRVLGVKKAV